MTRVPLPDTAGRALAGRGFAGTTSKEIGARAGRPLAPVRGVMLAVLPCMALMIAPKELPARLLPGAAKDGEALTADFVCFAMAGLQALALTHRPARPKAAANVRSKP
ncbi:MAG TPA: hypothetical protein PKB14_03315 [Rubrivivax sp.]|nr:hypothetical protein [Rubrivivax sp.]